MVFILVTIILVSTAIFGKGTVLDLIIISEIHSSTVWSTAPNGAHGYFTISWQYCRGHEGCLCTHVHSLTVVCFCLSFDPQVYSLWWVFFLMWVECESEGVWFLYWRVFLTSQLDFLHILLTSSSFLSLVMGLSLFPLKPVSFSISPMQDSQASVVLFVVFKPVHVRS